MADQVYSEADDSDAGSDQDKEALFLRLRSWFRADRRHWSDWRKEAREDYDFVSGEQWKQVDKSDLEEQGRPIVTFNRIGPVIDSIGGLEVSNRQEVRYIPRQVGSAGVNELLTGAGEWARDECDAEDEESDSFQDAAICGIGATETRPDYSTDPEGKIIVDRLDPMLCVVDGGATKKNFADRRRHFYVKRMPMDQARDMFPDAEDDDLHAGWASLEFDENEPHDATPQRAYNQGDQGDGAASRSTVDIVFCEWWETETFHRVLIAAPGLEPVRKDVNSADLANLRKRADQLSGMGMPVAMKVVPGKRRKYMQAFLGASVLDSGPGRCQYSFSINFITGKRDRNKGTFYGVVRVMKDPQRWANKFFSTALHDLATSGKGIIAESDAFENWREAEAAWTSYDKIVKAMPGAISKNKIMPKPAPTAQAQLANLMEYAISSIRDVSGINLELLGLVDREQAGVLEYQRKQAGMTILATLFDSLRRYRKIQGRLMLHLIQDYISDGRLIKITGPEGAQYVPLVRDPNTAEYDVIVDEAGTSPNLKERTWAVLTQMIPVISKLGMPPQMWAELLKYSPLPSSLTEKLSQMLQQGAQAQIPQQVQGYIEQLTKQLQDTQQQLGSVQQQNLQLKADQTAKIMDAQTTMAVKQQEMDLKMKEANLKAEISALELQMKGAQTAHEVFTRSQLADQQMQQNHQKMAIEQTKADNENQIATKKARAEMGPAYDAEENLGTAVSTIADLATAMAKAAEQISEAVKEMNKPRRIVRDAKTGRATGIETVH